MIVVWGLTNLSHLYFSRLSLAMPAKLNFFKTPASEQLVSSRSISTSTGISGCFQPGQAKVGPGPTPLVWAPYDRGAYTPLHTTSTARDTQYYATSKEPVPLHNICRSHNVHMYTQNKVSTLLPLVLITSYVLCRYFYKCLFANRTGALWK